MEVTARPATPGDVDSLLRLYRELAAEMAALRDMWPLADGVAEPAGNALQEMITTPEWQVYIGEIDGVPLGFLAGHDEATLPQGDGMIVGSIRFIFTEEPARLVGVGEAMMNLYLEEAVGRGIERFDAHVSPGHREAKNFYESNGFRARSIIMHRGDR